MRQQRVFFRVRELLGQQFVDQVSQTLRRQGVVWALNPAAFDWYLAEKPCAIEITYSFIVAIYENMLITHVLLVLSCLVLSQQSFKVLVVFT